MPIHELDADAPEACARCGMIEWPAAERRCAGCDAPLCAACARVIADEAWCDACEAPDRDDDGGARDRDTLPGAR